MSDTLGEDIDDTTGSAARDAACMVQEAMLAAWPARHSTRQNVHTSDIPDELSFLGAALNDTGTELWVASEAPGGTSLTLSGYGREVNGHWTMRFSFAGVRHLPPAAVVAPIALHLLPAARAVVLVCPSGLVVFFSVYAQATQPIRFQLSEFQIGKSVTLTRAVRAGGADAPARDMLAHVRLHVGRRTLVIERFVCGALGGAARPIVPKLRAEVALAALWPSLCAVSPADGRRVAPARVLDAVWAATAVEGAEEAWRVGAGGNPAPPASPQPQRAEDVLLVALDTKLLRVAPPPQLERGIVEDTMGLKHEAWLAQPLDLPVTPLVGAPVGAPRRESSSAVPGIVPGVSSCIGSADSDGSPLSPPALGRPRLQQPAAPASAVSSVAGSRDAVSTAGSEAIASRSVLRRFLEGVQPPGAATGAVASAAATAPSSAGGSGWGEFRGAASTFSGRIAALYHRRSASGPGAPAPAAVHCIRILPISPPPALAASAGAEHALAASWRGYERHLVVAPPFAIVVDSTGAPDPAYAVLDIPRSLRGSGGSGGSGSGGFAAPLHAQHPVHVLDAAVALDKVLIAVPSGIVIYEWTSDALDGASAGLMTGPWHGALRLDRVQTLPVPPSAFSRGGRACARTALHGGPRCAVAVATGPSRVAVYGPQAAGVAAERLVMRGDMSRACALVSTEVDAAARAQRSAASWVHLTTGLAIASCLRAGRWMTALDFYALTDPEWLHPAQLIAPVLPSMLARSRRHSAPVGRAAASTALEGSVAGGPARSIVAAGGAAADATPTLLAAARDALTVAVAETCPLQPFRVTHELGVLAAEAAAGSDGPAVAAVAALERSPTTARRWESGTLGSPRAPVPPLPLAPAASTCVGDDSARAACGALAEALCEALAAAHPGRAACAEPGSERFSRLRKSLAESGELRPHGEPGLHAVATGALVRAHSSDAARSVDGVVVRGGKGDAGSLTDDREGVSDDLDAWDWAWAVALWLLALAGRIGEAEAMCGAPPPRIARGRAGGHGHALGLHLATLLQEASAYGAAGLLLRAIDETEAALAVWMAEFDEASVAATPGGLCLTPLQDGEGGPRALSECRTLEEHVTACAAREEALGMATSGAMRGKHRAAARALLAAARVAETLCDAAGVPRLGDDAAAWLLRLPAQCVLGVLLARCGDGDATGTAAGDVLPMFHSLGSLATPRPGAADDERGAGAAQDAGVLWLQVRYLRSCVRRIDGTGARTPGVRYNGASRNVTGEGASVSTASDTWSAYLLSLLQLLASDGVVSNASCPPRRVGADLAVHPVYGPQTVAAGSLVDTWMSDTFLQALCSPDASPAVAALLEPLCPVFTPPWPLNDACVSGAAMDAAPQLPLLALFERETACAPPGAVHAALATAAQRLKAGCRGPERDACIALLECDGSARSLWVALDALLPPQPQPQHDGAASAVPAEGVCTRSSSGLGPAADSVVAAARLIARVEARGAEGGGADSEGHAELAASMWGALAGRVSPAGRVWVAHLRGHVGALGVAPPLAIGKVIDAVATGSTRLGDVSEAVTCCANAARDAAAWGELQRALGMHALQAAARQHAEVVAASVRWREGPTSMDQAAPPEATIACYADGQGEHSTLAPPGKAGRPWCSVCERDLPRRGRGGANGRLLSYALGGFLCDSADCASRAVAFGAAAEAPRVRQQVLSRSGSTAAALAAAVRRGSPAPTPERRSASGVATATLRSSCSLGVDALAATPLPRVSEAASPGRRHHGGFVAGGAHYGYRWLVTRGGRVVVEETDAVLGSGARWEGDAASARRGRSVATGALVEPNPADPTTAAVVLTYAAALAESPHTLPWRRRRRGAGSTSGAAATSDVRIVSLSEGGESGPLPGLSVAPVAAPPSDVGSSVVAAAWSQDGRAVLTAHTSGHVVWAPHPATHGSALAARVPAAYGHTLGLATVAGDDLATGGLVIATGTHLLLLAADDGTADAARAALARCRACPPFWASAVLVATGGAGSPPRAGPSALASHTLSVLRVPGSDVAHISWLSAGVVYTLDVDLHRLRGEPDGGAAAGPRATCQRDTLVACALPHAVRPVALVVLPRHTLVLDAPAAAAVAAGGAPPAALVAAPPPQLLALSRATGSVVAAVRPLSLELGDTPALLSDSEDPSADPASGGAAPTPTVTLVGLRACARVATLPDPLGVAQELVSTGRYADARVQLEAPAAGAVASGEEVARGWSALGRALHSAGRWREAGEAWGHVESLVATGPLFGAHDGDRATAGASQQPLVTFREAALRLMADARHAARAEEAVDALAALVATRLHSLCQHRHTDATATSLAVWLFQLLLMQHNTARLRAVADGADGTAAAVANVERRLRDFAGGHARLLPRQVAHELVRQRGTHARALGGVLERVADPLDHFHDALRGDDPAQAISLLPTLKLEAPEATADCVHALLARHPVATYHALAAEAPAGQSADPALVASAAAPHLRAAAHDSADAAARSVLRALRGYLEHLVLRCGCGVPAILGTFAESLVVSGDEDGLLHFLQSPAARAIASRDEDTSGDRVSAPHPSLRFDADAALCWARQRGMSRAAAALYAARGDHVAAVEHATGLDHAAEVIHAAPDGARRALWLQVARCEVGSAARSGGCAADAAAAVCSASDGALRLADVLGELPRSEWRESGLGGTGLVRLAARALEQGAGARDSLAAAFDSLNRRVGERRATLGTTSGHPRPRPTPLQQCGHCGGQLRDAPRRALPHGGELPEGIWYPGATYHAACAVHAATKYAAPRARETALRALRDLAAAAPEGAPAPLRAVIERAVRCGDPGLRAEAVLESLRLPYGESDDARALVLPEAGLL